jgi:tetratricopeptide (TPR) repeat protein/tRNA A-37 threonylcarbamoyl transferase component Bud32
MFEQLTCPAGHSWQRSAGADETNIQFACPKCGAAAVGSELCSPEDRGRTGPYLPAAADERTLPEGEERSAVPGYEILELLGIGGMGVVYKARHIGLKRLVALKMMKRSGHMDGQRLDRFRLEAESLARLQHPNIVQIFEVGEAGAQPFIALEYVDGGSLASLLAANPLPAHESARLSAMLTRAVHAAHEQGVVHRDLKPANVLLTKAHVPKVTDFGLAKQLDVDSCQTQAGQILGTPSYMAPEQAQGDGLAVGPLTDVYALGAILYEMLTGRPPFRAPSVIETLEQVRSADPVPPSRLQPKCPRDLETICLKCLQKEPHRRFPSCEALAADLGRFLAGEPILARRVGRAERTWRWCRRNPYVAILSAAVCGLLLTLAISLIVLAEQRGRTQQAVAETDAIARSRLEQATDSIAVGNYGRAHDLLRWSDPLLESNAELAGVRSELEKLKTQVDVYGEFRQLLDDARFTCRFGSRQEKVKGQGYCRRLIELYDQIEGREGRAAFGLPPLNAEHQQLFKEDVFEAFLTAAQVQQDLAQGGGADAEQQAARQALDWLNRAAQVLPGTRALHVHRAPCWLRLGNLAARDADMERALIIAPTSAVDRFWHGFAHHLRGDEALRRKDTKAALDFYRKEIAEYAAYLQLRPDSYWGYFNWANSHATLNEPSDRHDALIGFTACIRMAPNFPWPLNNRGTIHLRLGEPDLALADFSAAIGKNDRYPEAYCNRGLAYLALGKEDRALEDFDRAISLNPDYTKAYVERAEIYEKRQKHAEAIHDYTRLLALGADKAPLLGKRVAAYLALGKSDQLDEAITEFREAARLHPGSAEVVNNVAWGLATAAEPKQRDGPRAVALARLACEVAPANGPYWRTFGVAEYSAGHWQEAVAALEKSMALRKEGDSVDWFFLAMAYSQMGQKDRAREGFDRAVGRSPVDERLWRLRAEAASLIHRGEPLPSFAEVRKAIDQAHTFAGRGKWRRAAAEYAVAVKFFPGYLELCGEYAGALSLAGDQEGYRRVCADVLHRFAEAADAENCYLLGRIASLAPGAAEPAQAVQFAEKGLARYRRITAWCLHSLAVAHYRAGQYESAVRRSEQSLKDDPAWPGHVVDWLVLAMAHQRLGHADEARQWMDKAVVWIDRAAVGLPKDAPFALPVPSWTDRLEVHLLRREADGLIPAAPRAEKAKEQK